MTATALALLLSLTPAATPAQGRTAATIALFDRPSALEGGRHVTISELLGELGERHGAQFRIDGEYFAAPLGGEDVYEIQLRLPSGVGRLPVRDILRQMNRRLSSRPASEHAIHVRGDQVVLGESAPPPPVAGWGEYGGVPFGAALSEVQASYYGPSVTVAADDKPLREFLDELRDHWGLNVIADPAIRDKLSAAVTLTLSDARALTALKLAARQAGLDAAPVDNAFTITDPETAEKRTRQWERNALGERPTVAGAAAFR